MPDARPPLIGITIGRDLPDHPGYLRLRSTYSEAVGAAGGLPVLIPPYAEPARLSELLARLDGLLLPGGLDVDPSCYGEPPHAETRVDAVLDRLELEVARWAVAHPRLPTLG